MQGNYGNAGYNPGNWNQPQSNQGRLHITKLLIQESGTYNDQYLRPYNTNMDPGMANVIEKNLVGAREFAPSMLTGIANSFVRQAATPEARITVNNGWGERRARFMMEVQVASGLGSASTMIVLGYTSFLGITPSGAIAPEMEFYINSVIQTRNTTIMTPMGNQTQRTMYDNSHILAKHDWEDAYSNNRTIGMRPQDVFHTMSRSLLDNSSTILDTRSLITDTAVKSRRSNCNPTNYMSDILNSYQKASLMNPGRETDTTAGAAGVIQENVTARDPFISAISQITGAGVMTDTFRYGDLMRLDPNVDNVAVVSFLSHEARRTTHMTGMTADWGGSDENTRVASSLAHSVSGATVDALLTNVAFKTTNETINGQIVTEILHVQGFSDMDLSVPVQRFTAALEQIVLSMTYGNSIPIQLEMRVDLLGETWIRMKLDYGPFVDYVVPSFCDALMAPITTRNMSLTDTVASDFNGLISMVTDANPVAMGSELYAGI